MKITIQAIRISVGALALVTSVAAQEARFFRMAGPAPTVITGFTADGYITWLTLQPGANYTVQTARNLAGPSNWVDYVQVPTTNWFTTNRLYDPNPPSGMVLIPAGSFTMGNCMDPGEGSSDELPLHTVYVSGFYMDRYEVSKALWDEVYAWATNRPAAMRYSFEYGAQGKASGHPAQSMTWYDAVKWCNARSEKEGRVPCYYTNASLSQAAIYRSGQFDLATNLVNWAVSGYRLATEAEWEKAARGGVSGHRFPWSDSDNIDWTRANYYAWPLSAGGYAYDVNPTEGYDPAWTNGGYPYTSPVGSFAANGYGLYDMAGNVLEWCWDRRGSYSSGSQTDPRGPASYSYRVIRGGTYGPYAFHCRSAYRDFSYPWYFYDSLGFRSVLPSGQ